METTSPSRNRQLAAILFADIAGYTALMQKDEKSALACLHKFKSELESQVPSHHGQIIQFYGDGCLVIFNSSVDAVKCAAALQLVFKEEPFVPVRIGLHAGDVVFRDGNVFGDAVNIASRVESLGEPGAVLLSSSVRNQIKNKSEFKLASLGRFEFKNVEGSMSVYALANDGFPVPQREEMDGKLKTPVKKKSNFYPIGAGLIFIVLIFVAGYFIISKNNKAPISITPDAITIFPFDVKGSPDIQYLGDGMVDLISTKLDEIPGINSIDPNRVFSEIKNISGISRQPDKAAAISKNFGANKFILGSIVEINNVLQITASKYDAAGNLLDKKNVEGNKNNQLAKTIDELVKQLIAEELKGQEYKTLGAITSGNMESLKAFLEGEQAYRVGNFKNARTHFKSATDLDSTFALAWMRLSHAAGWDVNADVSEANENWKKYKHKLPQKWQEYSDAHSLHVEGNQKTEAAFKELIRKYGESRAFINGLAEFYFHFNPVYGRSQLEAKPYLEKNLKLEPNNIESFVHLSECALMEGDMDALQKMKVEVRPESEIYPEIQIKILMLQDSATDEEISELVNHPHFRNEFLFRTFIPIKNQPIDFELLNRILEQYPDKIFRLLSITFELGNNGQENVSFQNWKELSDRKEEFYVPLKKYYRCMPASLIADKSFLPLAEFYPELFDAVKGKESPWEIFAAIKYAIALGKENEAGILKIKLEEKINDPQNSDNAKYYHFSLKAFEARIAEKNEEALVWIDSAYQYPNGFWDIQTSSMDKTIMQANIYAEHGEYEKAIPYFENLNALGVEFLTGYATFRLSEWYEKIGNREMALTKCNFFLEAYKNCDEKYRPWVEEVEKRKQRLISSMQ